MYAQRAGRGQQDGAAGARSAWRRPAPLPYRLDVVGVDVEDVVHAIGGWLYDHVMAGWQVNVMMPQLDDVRALNILGVRATVFTAPLQSSESTVLAVSARILHRDSQLRQSVLRLLDGGPTQVAVWGEPCLAEVDHRLGHLQYQLGPAAKTFKSQALLATTNPHANVQLLEGLRTGPAPVEAQVHPLLRATSAMTARCEQRTTC